MEEEFSIKKLKGMIEYYLRLEEYRMSLILEEWKDENNFQVKQELEEVEEKINENKDKLLYANRNNEILNKVEEKLRGLMEKVGGVSPVEYIDGFYPNAINDLVDEVLIEELIEKDKTNLKNPRVYTAFKGDLEKELDEECRSYNADICYNKYFNDRVTVMEGTDNKGRKQVIYYYPDSFSDWDFINSQRREYNENHKNMSQLSDAEKKEELMKVHEKVQTLTGYEMFLFRPPYGDYDNAVVNVAKDCGYYTIQWDVDSLDWKDYGVDSIIKTVTEHKHLGNGSIILCHNGAKYTAQALDTLITQLKEKGYTFVPVSELIYRDGYHMNVEGRQIKN